MAFSTTIKNKMLAVTHLKYRRLVEIKNEDGDWIYFSGRDPRPQSLRLATEKKKNQVVSSVSAVTFTNDDNYFNWMDDPDHATTVSKFGTLASKFSNGFKGKQIQFVLRVFLPDGTYEDACMGSYRIDKGELDSESNRYKFKLKQDVDFLKKIGTSSISDGLRHHQNKPITYLLREILKRFYTAGVTSADFEIPDRIYLETADGEPAFSHYGKPPEKDTTGRWRNDITKKPTAMYYHSANDTWYFGIEDEVWSFDMDKEEWSYRGSFGEDNFYIRGIYPMISTRLLVVGWKTDHESRSTTLKTGNILTTSHSFTTNDPAYNTLIYSGDFVLRDTIHDGGDPLTFKSVGRMKNCPGWGSDELHGVNMPVPLPNWPHSGMSTAFPKYIGITDDLRNEIASGNWTTFGTGDNPHGIDVVDPCYMAYRNAITGSSSARPELLVPWGMAPNLCWAPSLTNWTGPYLFVVQTDGDPLGIRCDGDVEIIAYEAYSGTKRTISENPQTSDKAPIYGLTYHKGSSSDYLWWIDVNWVEEFTNITGGASPGDCDPPIFRIKFGILSDDGGGNPELLDAAIYTWWTAGDDDFDADDSEFAPITIRVIPNAYTLSGYIIQMLDMADMGGDCYKLFYVDNASPKGVTELDSCKMGYGGFTWDDVDERLYFIQRDTGRACYIDCSGSAPSTINFLADGEEPIPQSFFEMPQASGFVIRTESSKQCIYGINYPALPGQAFEGLVWPQGKYYLWKYHFQLTDRVELFDEDKQNGWEAMGLLAEAVNHQVGLDPEGTGFFRPIPDGSEAEEFTIDLDSAICRHIKFKKLGGEDEIINRSQFIPYEAVPGVPDGGGDLIGYISNGSQVVFDGEILVKSEILEEKNITLHCIKPGPPGTAVFKYLVHNYQIQTVLREDMNPAILDQIRLDNNQDLEVGMFVQIGDWDEGAKIQTIQSDGDVILDTSAPSASPRGTLVVFRSAEHGLWSTEYDTPDEFTSSTSWAEIGSTGIFLQLTAGNYNFAIGDRLNLHNPGMELQSSKTKKYMEEDSDSIEKYGASEYNPDNPYISLTLGRALVKSIVATDSERHHGWQFDCPLFLQAKPHMLVKVKSRKQLPTATDNEEKCYIKQVTHDDWNARTNLILRAVDSYG